MNWCHYGGLGEILMTGMALPDSTMEDFAHIGAVLVSIPAGVSGDSHFVENGDLKERAGMGVYLVGNTLKNVPFGAALTIDGSSVYEVNDGEAELVFESPGKYSVLVSKWPFIDWSFTFEN